MIEIFVFMKGVEVDQSNISVEEARLTVCVRM